MTWIPFLITRIYLHVFFHDGFCVSRFVWLTVHQIFICWMQLLITFSTEGLLGVAIECCNVITTKIVVYPLLEVLPKCRTFDVGKHEA